MGAPKWPPSPPSFGAPRRSRGAPLISLCAWAPKWPPSPLRSEHPGEAVALLYIALRWGPEMAPKPPFVRSTPAKPWRSSISLCAWAPKWPPSPLRSEHPGEAVALLYIALRLGPEMAPKPPSFGAPRRSRGAPLYRFALGPRNGPQAPFVRSTPAQPGRSSISRSSYQSTMLGHHAAVLDDANAGARQRGGGRVVADAELEPHGG